MIRAALLMSCVLLVAACTSRAIIMRDPKTGQTADCGSRSEAWIWDVASNPGRACRYVLAGR
jgi:hypothetical protein